MTDYPIWAKHLPIKRRYAQKKTWKENKRNKTEEKNKKESIRRTD